MHKITIKGLGPIKEIKDFEINRINAVIGESATGKSLLAKAIYLFNMPEFIRSLLRGLDEAKEELSANAKLIFGAYKNFSIEYKYTDTYKISIKNYDNDKDLTIELSSKFTKHISETSQQILEENQQIKVQKTAEQLSKIIQELNKGTIILAHLKELVNELPESTKENIRATGNFLQDLGIGMILYIPATRSFITDYHDMILDIHSKRNILENYNNDIILNHFSIAYRNLLKNFEHLSHELMRGAITKNNERIKFTAGKQVLDIADTSSGQKAIFPILMVLQQISDLLLSDFYPYTIIIEEPEAHIYPKDQKLILDEIIKFANKTKSKVFITTHSPYILMAMNNLIEANTRKYKELEELFIDVKEANVQMLANGKSKNLIDAEDKTIDLEYIENIENEIIEEFTDILNSDK